MLRIGVVMAGGYGTRLAEAGQIVPKPLQVVGGKTLLARVVGWLKSNFTLDRIVVVAFHRAERVMEAVTAMADPMVGCVIEPHKAGTAGELTKLAHIFPPETEFVVMNADVLTNWKPADYRGANWVAAVTREVDVPFGSLEEDFETGYLNGVREKWATYEAAAGIYGLRGECVRESVPSPIAIDMPDLLGAIASRRPVLIARIHTSYYWRDIATQADLEKARADAEEGRLA